MLSSLLVLITGICIRHVPTFSPTSVSTAYAHKWKLITEVFWEEDKHSGDLDSLNSWYFASELCLSFLSRKTGWKNPTGDLCLLRKVNFLFKDVTEEKRDGIVIQNKMIFFHEGTESKMISPILSGASFFRSVFSSSASWKRRPYQIFPLFKM